MLPTTHSTHPTPTNPHLHPTTPLALWKVLDNFSIPPTIFAFSQAWYIHTATEMKKKTKKNKLNVKDLALKTLRLNYWLFLLEYEYNMAFYATIGVQLGE